MSGRSPLAPLLEKMPLRAASFIVTVYGDMVVPRGEVLWMGNLIDICGRVGISESLVRTAASRLVQGGQLVGEKVGRRSYYRLAPDARAEFTNVARLIYAAPKDPVGWIVLHAPDVSEDVAKRLRLGRIENGVFLTPDHGQAPHPGTVFRLPLGGVTPARAAADYWPLDRIAERYQALVDIFAPLENRARELGGADALIARLLLVEAYRRAVLADPLLPTAALPDGWIGKQARALFSLLYIQLSCAADDYIGANLEGESGRLPAETDVTRQRLAQLSTEASAQSFDLASK